jgi:hypothetical protein
MQLHTLIPKRVIGAAVIAGAAAMIPVAALAATASAPAAPAAARTPACATSGLVIWLSAPPGNGYAGGDAYDLNFTNLSGHACTLRGTPGVSAVSLRGRQLGSSASGDYSGKARAIRLANGATAIAVLSVGHATYYPPKVCRPVTAAGLRVYPPNQYTSKVVPWPSSACSRKGPVWMSVRPVAKTGIPG